MQQRLWLLIGLGFWEIAACSAAPAYRLSVLPVPAGFVMSRACDITSHGEIAGWAATDDEVCLVHWTKLGRLQRSGERLAIVDVNAGESPMRFYRVVPATAE